jgi:cytochrome c-type biogenesis protein CcmH
MSADTGIRVRRGSWLVMGGVLLVALAIGLQPDDTARTPEDRVFEVAEGYKCPTCRSQSVADSEAPSAKAIRAEIARRLEAGQSEDQIRDYLVGRFGEEILLTPSASGVTGLVWVIPVVAVAAAGAGLVLAFRRWQRRPSVTVTEEDRELVAEARGSR